jgi:hypothetical protein
VANVSDSIPRTSFSAEWNRHQHIFSRRKYKKLSRKYY